MPSPISIPDDSTSLELEEFVEIIEENKYDLNEDCELLVLAKQLNKLNNNKKLLLDHIANELTDLSAFQESNVYDNNTFVLHRSKNFLLRAVVWLPLHQSGQNHIFDTYHDHNFDLLTIGYFGPGYKTETFTYNNADVIGLIGEQVEVEKKGIFTLAQGHLLLYKAKKDIHNQIPPESMSVSLNVIPLKNAFNRPQFEFDKNNFTIRRYLHISSNELTIRLAGILGNENDIEVLKKILVHHNNSHLRAYAANAITQISDELSDDVNEWINESKDKAAIDIFQKERNKYGFVI